VNSAWESVAAIVATRRAVGPPCHGLIDLAQALFVAYFYFLERQTRRLLSSDPPYFHRDFHARKPTDDNAEGDLDDGAGFAGYGTIYASCTQS